MFFCTTYSAGQVTAEPELTAQPPSTSHGIGRFGRGLVVNAAGVILFLATLWLAVRSKAQLPLWEFLSVMTLMWAALICAFVAAPSKASRATFASLWTFALLFRTACFFAEPIFEDDWYRYLWDGRTLAVEGNPYRLPPAAYFTGSDLPPRFERILDNINYPHVPTIYGPVCQYVFALSYLLAPGELWPLKLLLILVDLLVVRCLLGLTAPRNALLYAWCPLVLHETAVNAHPEILGVAPAVLGLFLLRGGKNRSALLAFGLSFAARIHGVLLAPFALLQMPARRWWLFPVTVAVLYLPFWAQGSLADWAGLRAFLSGWEFNSTVYAVIAWATGPLAAKLFCAGAFALFYGLLLRREGRTATIPPGDLVYGIFFLLSAVVNPWYVLWLAPFVALFPSFTGATACAVVTLSYVHGLNYQTAGLPPYEHPWWVRPAEIAAVVIAFFGDYRLRLQADRNAG